MLNEVYEDIHRLEVKRNNIGTKPLPLLSSRSSSTTKTITNQSNRSTVSVNSVVSQNHNVTPNVSDDEICSENGAVGGGMKDPSIEAQEALKNVQINLLSTENQQELVQEFVRMYQEKLSIQTNSGIHQKSSDDVRSINCAQNRVRPALTNENINAPRSKPTAGKTNARNSKEHGHDPSAHAGHSNDFSKFSYMPKKANSNNVQMNRQFPSYRNSEPPQYEDISQDNVQPNWFNVKNNSNSPQYIQNLYTYRDQSRNVGHNVANANRNGRNERQNGLDNPQNNTGPNISANRIRKTVPVHQWRCSFSGDGKGAHLYDFLTQVSIFQRSEHVSNVDLFESIIHLLNGRARLWYLATRDQYENWNDFVVALKAEFLPENYDFILMNDISNRVQKQNESFAEFITQMLSAFKCLSIELSEDYKLFIVKRNLLPKYSEAIAPFQIQTLAQLSQMCRSIDNSNVIKRNHSLPFQQYPSYTDNFRNHFGRDINLVDSATSSAAINETDTTNIPSFSKNSDANFVEHRGNQTDDQSENELQEVWAFQNNRPQRRMQNGQYGTTRPKCWNCLQEGHLWQNCAVRKEVVFCYSCGFRGVVSINCPKCRGNDSRDPGRQGKALDPNQNQTSQAN